MAFTSRKLGDIEGGGVGFCGEWHLPRENREPLRGGGWGWGGGWRDGGVAFTSRKQATEEGWGRGRGRDICCLGQAEVVIIVIIIDAKRSKAL